MVSVSFSSRRMVTTCEHVIPARPAFPQLVGRSDAQEYPDSPGSPFSMSTISKDTGIDDTSSKAATQDGLKLGPFEDLGVKAARPGASSGRGSTSFV
jgi:hypothetical protein